MTPRTAVLLIVVLLSPATSQPVVAEDVLKEDEAVSHWAYYNNMGWKAFLGQDYEVAEFRFTRAIQAIRPYEKRHLTKLTRSYHDLTRVLCSQKRYEEAQPLAKWVVEAHGHDQKVRDDVRFDAVYLLAVIERELHHDAEVVPLLARAVEIEARNTGAGSPRLALTIRELADAEAAVGLLAEADADYQRVIRIHERSAPSSPDLVAALSARAQVLRRLGRTVAAQTVEARAAEIQSFRETSFKPATR